MSITKFYLLALCLCCCLACKEKSTILGRWYIIESTGRAVEGRCPLFEFHHDGRFEILTAQAIQRVQGSWRQTGDTLAIKYAGATPHDVMPEYYYVILAATPDSLLLREQETTYRFSRKCRKR